MPNPDDTDVESEPTDVVADHQDQCANLIALIRNLVKADDFDATDLVTYAITLEYHSDVIDSILLGSN